MKKLLMLASLLIAQTSLSAEKFCPIVLATGPRYDWNYQYQLPKDYQLKLVKKLEEKGYDVVETMNIGTYAWNGMVNEEAVKFNAKSLIFRPALNYIQKGNTEKNEIFCRMDIYLSAPNMSFPEVNVGFEGKATTFYPMAILSCDAVFNRIVKNIPDCEQKIEN